MDNRTREEVRRAIQLLDSVSDATCQRPTEKALLTSDPKPQSSQKLYPCHKKDDDIAKITHLLSREGHFYVDQRNFRGFTSDPDRISREILKHYPDFYFCTPHIVRKAQERKNNA